jgi:hypothetical protein
MKEYKIQGQQTNFYNFTISANSEQEAIDEVRRIENFNDINEYIDFSEPMEITLVMEASNG